MTHKKLEKDTTIQYNNELTALVEFGYRSRVLTMKEKKYFAPSCTSIPIIYTIPKIHKDPLNPPARPIVNGIQSVTSWMGQHLDCFLQKSVIGTKAYLRDTKNILQLLDEVRFTENDEILLVTADVSSLYKVLQHDDTILALNWALSQREDLPYHQKILLHDALDFCLSHNYFWFNNNFFFPKERCSYGF